MSKTPTVVDAYLAEVQQTRGAHAVLDRFVASLAADRKDVSDVDYRARDLVDCLAVALQASLLVRHAPGFVSDAFCRSRLEQQGHHNYGSLPRGVDVAAIIARATPSAD